MMKIALAGAGLLLLAAVAWPLPAAAQGLPRGSYLNSCFNAGMRGDALVATCRMANGRTLRTALAGVGRCVGDIGNNNGVLQCMLPGGRQARGEVLAELYQPPPPPYPAPPPYAGPAPSPAPLPYPVTPLRYPPDRCGVLHRSARELRIRRDRTFDPVERGRLEEQLRRVRGEEAAHCRY